jgi:pyruvate-formate lyase
MLTPAQAKRLSYHRTIVAHTRRFGNTPQEQFALRYAQMGLPFTAEHAAYLTVHLTSPDAIDLAGLRKIARTLHDAAAEDAFQWIVVIGVSLPQWTHWCRAEGLPLDNELFSGEDRLRRILTGDGSPFKLTHGDLFFHVKAVEKNTAEQVANRILSYLAGAYEARKTEYTIGDSLHDGRVYGGRMLHGLIGSVDPVCFSVRAIIGDELPPHKGGCFGLTQRFVHDWEQLLGMADIDLENLIGRDHTGTIITNDDVRSHVKCVRVNDENGVNYRLVGESQPFRSSGEMYGKEDGIYQVSYAKSVTAFAEVLGGMFDVDSGQIKSRHLLVSQANLGNYWYVPNATELGLKAPHPSLTVPMNDFFEVRSNNGRMFYNTKDYLHQLGNRTGKAKLLDPLPTDRVVELLGYTFSRWHDTWYRRRPTPELDHLETYLSESEKEILTRSVAERKGFATRKTLELLSSEPEGRKFDTFRLHPRELIVGVVPEYTLGTGFEGMRYLNREEQDEAFVLRLNESGAAGHNVPDYGRLLKKGVGGLLADVKARLTGAADQGAREFYQSVIYSLEGVQIYLRNYAELARKILAGMRFGTSQDRENLIAIALRLDKLAEHPPETFPEAAQLIFSMHCCLHIAGESVSIGRLDQLLGPFYNKDGLSEKEAQEIIDCFWIKMDEKVLLNHRHFHDRLSRGSGAITYQGGDFPQGAAINQWVQQVTVGGYKANDAKRPEDGCNAVTMLCLRAARRLPMNAPCLSLRVNPETPRKILKEAARALLAGGAHPFLINDQKIVAGLLRSARESGTRVDLADARDMVCDGCFESIMAGKTEFAFSFVPVHDAIEMALNRGRTYAAAGPVHIAGLKASYRSERPEDIKTFEQFYGIFLKHYRYKLVEFYDGMISRYGNLSRVCPSPLLSALIDDCLESGRDLSAGGARYKLLAPLMNGIATAIDALWAIKDMVFSDEAVFTLAELTQCLICDWGHDMKEPFCSSTMGDDRIAVLAERFKKLRGYALGRPKFGQGHAQVDRFARRVLRDLIKLAYDLVREKTGLIARELRELRHRYGTSGHPFEIVITPGIATFEDYAGIGSFLGASADGRRACQPVASDFSPSPTQPDLPVPGAGRSAEESLKSWAAGPADDGPGVIDPIGIGLSNGSPVDINIREDFPEGELLELIVNFAQGELGSNMMSITCADPDTLTKAQNFPECYDLVRMRMGGWSEFFVAMFPQHQEHHKRRSLFEAKGRPTTAGRRAW